MRSFDAFILMPFGSNEEYGGGETESNYVYEEIIEPAIRDAARQLDPDRTSESDDGVQVNITREVDRNQGGSITASMVRSLIKADVVVVDVTGRNPNVFLELGIRYAVRNKVTVLLAQGGTQIPFDIKGYRFIEYNRFRPREVRAKLSEFIREGMSDKCTSDSVVFDVFPSMSVSIPGVVQSLGVEAASQPTTMSFDEYMRHIEHTCIYLESALREYRYKPTAVIGISNGGLIAADLIGKRVYAGGEIPILSLWARRSTAKGDSAFYYFDNEYNDATMDALKKATGANHIELLLIDDHMGTGGTARQAVYYVRSRLGDDVRLLYVPVITRRTENIGVVEEFLPYSRKDQEGKPVFPISKEQFLSLVSTEAMYFPYLKKQINVSTSG